MKTLMTAFFLATAAMIAGEASAATPASVAAICPAGTRQVFNSCTSDTPPTCPPGMKRDANGLGPCASFQTCSPGFRLNLRGNCVSEGSPPSCPPGTTLDTRSPKCVATPTCPAGASFNPQTASCNVPPICPAGTNPVNGVCVATAAPACASGLILLPQGNFAAACMEPARPCPAGTTANPQRNTCEVTPICPTGTSAGPGYSGCTAQATCPKGKTLQGGRCS